MAKNLTFSIGGAEYEAAPVKIERKKLYGWTETAALDDDSAECLPVQLDESEALIIPKGGVGLGILDEKGGWVERAALKTVTPEGGEALLLPSSYDAPVVLADTVTVDEFLAHTITALYELQDAPPALIAALDGGICRFTYNPRADYEGQDAFVFAQDGTLYMLAGYNADFRMIGLDENAVLEDDVEEDEEDPEELDFNFV